MRYALLKTDSEDNDRCIVDNFIVADEGFITQHQGVLFELAVPLSDDQPIGENTRYRKSTQAWEELFTTSAERVIVLHEELEVKKAVVEEKLVEVTDAEKEWLSEALIPYWSGPWNLPTTHAAWEEAFRCYIYDPPDLLPYIDGMTLDEYYAARMADVKRLGGTNADYFEVFKQMVFAIEVGVVLPSLVT